MHCDKAGALDFTIVVLGEVNLGGELRDMDFGGFNIFHLPCLCSNLFFTCGTAVPYLSLSPFGSADSDFEVAALKSERNA